MLVDGDFLRSIKDLLVSQNTLLVSQNTELVDKIHSLELRQHVMNEKLPKLTEVFITPSEYKKSKHKETFLDMLGFGRMTMSDRVKVFDGVVPHNSADLNYTFQWHELLETDSYKPLQAHLGSKGIDVTGVGDGQGLPDGLLYLVLEEEHLIALRNPEEDWG